MPKFREGGLNIARAGRGRAHERYHRGWVASGARGTTPVTREVRT